MSQTLNVWAVHAGAGGTGSVDADTGHSVPVIDRVVSVADLQRAWRAVRAGEFSSDPGRPTGRRSHKPVPVSWMSTPGERVVPVVGCGGACGATTLALALAEAAESPARVVECGSGATSGLAAASTAELGAHRSGWVQGTRGEVLLERADGAWSGPTEVPVPSSPDRTVALTVLDVGWELGRLLGDPCWLADQVTHAAVVVLVAACTVPGLRRLESVLALLPGTPTVASVVGPPRRRWPAIVEQGAGSLTRALDAAGRLTVLPTDRRLFVSGLDPGPLPAPLLTAAAELLRLADDHPSKGTCS